MKGSGSSKTTIMPSLQSKMKAGQSSFNKGERNIGLANKRKTVPTADPASFYNKKPRQVIGVGNGVAPGRPNRGRERALSSMYSQSDRHQDDLFQTRRRRVERRTSTKEMRGPKPQTDNNEDDPICISSDDEDDEVRSHTMSGGMSDLAVNVCQWQRRAY